MLLLFDGIISANNYYYLHVRFAIADDESVLNLKDIEWSNENLLEMSSLEEESIEPPRKVARPDKVATIMKSLVNSPVTWPLNMCFQMRAPLRLNFRIPGHDCVTLNACSRSPAVNKYLHMETKEKNLMYTQSKRATHEYTSF